jgi:DUF4097 and DUF4098 domain-containing protein YvlB
VSGFTSQLVEDASLIDRVRIEIGSGRVEIVPNDGTETAVTLEVDSGTEEDIVFKVHDGELIVEGDLAVNTGSGDVKVGRAAGTVRASTGSGSITIDEAADALGLSTGSGDVRVGDAAGPTTVKVGSGDITIERIRDHSVATSGSGDVRVEIADGPSVQAETARGDVQIGVPDGVPAYLDLKTVTGRIRCDLEPGEKPAEGERALMLRARTVSGDISVVKV